MNRCSVLLMLVVLAAGRLYASHIVGGEMMYQYIGTSKGLNQYRINLFLFVDCNNGNPKSIEDDKQAYLNVFEKNNNGTYTIYDSRQLSNARSGPETVSDVKYSCIVNKPDVCVNKYTFTVDLYLPANEAGYVVTFERCCRNNSINNIYNAENTGATYWVHIPGTKLVDADNSPVFKSLPPTFLCLNAPLTFDHSATDADGDSLVYELFTPFAGGSRNNTAPGRNQATNPANFSNIRWLSAAGYDAYNQIDGEPGLSVNSANGKLTLTPTVEGQFVIGVKVLEYRKGVLIGETKRDFQFNVASCRFSVVSALSAPKMNCTENIVTFKNQSQGATSYQWDFGDKVVATDISADKNPVYTYTKPGSYTVTLIARSTVCADTFQYDLSVKQNFKTILPKDTLFCGAFTKVLSTNQSDKTFKWSTGSTAPMITVNKGGTYWVSVSDAPCASSDTITIINDLNRIELGPDSVICRDSFVQFDFHAEKGFTTYNWNDRSSGPDVRISSLGSYYVRVVDANNCASEDSITFVLYPPPRVNLNDTLFCRNTSVWLDGVNYNAITHAETTYQWSNGASTSKVSVSLPGMYTVKVSNKLCTVLDTAVLAYIESGLDLGPDTFYCGAVSRFFSLPAYTAYTWKDGSVLPTFTATEPGLVMVRIVTKEGCLDMDSMRITGYGIPDAGLGNDTTICTSSALTIAAADNMTAYVWNTGATGQHIEVKDSGLYIVTITDPHDCMISDSIRISESGSAMPAEMFIPDAFTPNGDQLNEVFPGNNYKNPGSAYDFRIYDRWGEMIFQGLEPAQQWTGDIKGDKAPEAVYIYMVRYTGCDDVSRWFRGTFTLLR
jgi:gliding motility-associated-like protein